MDRFLTTTPPVFLTHAAAASKLSPCLAQRDLHLSPSPDFSNTFTILHPQVTFTSQLFFITALGGHGARPWVTSFVPSSAEAKSSSLIER